MENILLKDCLEFIKDEYEYKAEQSAIDSELGVSEWESFMPEIYHRIKHFLEYNKGN